MNRRISLRPVLTGLSCLRFKTIAIATAPPTRNGTSTSHRRSPCKASMSSPRRLRSSAISFRICSTPRSDMLFEGLERLFRLFDRRFRQGGRELSDRSLCKEAEDRRDDQEYAHDDEQ